MTAGWRMLRRRSSGGMSMTNVLVAFVVLVLLVMLFSRVMTTCQNMVRAADQLRQENTQIMGDYYTGDAAVIRTKLADDSIFSFSSPGGYAFDLTVDVDAYESGNASLYSISRGANP